MVHAGLQPITMRCNCSPHPPFWAVEIWIILLLAVFVTMHELSRAVGKDKLRLIFFGR